MPRGLFLVVRRCRQSSAAARASTAGADKTHCPVPDAPPSAPCHISPCPPSCRGERGLRHPSPGSELVLPENRRGEGRRS